MFHTKYNAMAINIENERILYSYINGFCNNYGVKLIRLGGMPDHIHMLVNMPTTESVSDFVKQLKVATSKMLYQDGHFPYFEGWQNAGYKEIKFLYYLNPKSLDRNLEWDMKNNLCTDPGCLVRLDP